MRINSFEDILAWQRAKTLTVEVYRINKVSKDQSYNNQIQRASVSIMNNIAEGFERRSNKEFKQYLYIAKGSCGEVRSMLQLGKELGYLSREESDNLVSLATEISKIISGLIKSL